MNMNYKNMGPHAAYRLAPMDHATYMATQEVSEWSCVPGWHLHTCVFDIMHNLFLGTGRVYIASGVRVLIEKGFIDKPGVERNSDAMFAEITMGIHDTFKRNRFLEHSTIFVCLRI
jgi:hypothetical protein